MGVSWGKTCACLCVAMCSSFSFAQKVKVGYDKTVDFAKYKTYSWTPPSVPITRPYLYQTVVATIDSELSSKGLTKVEKDGDLTLIGSGGLDFATTFAAGAPLDSTYSGTPPSMNATVWTGAQGSGQLMGMVPDGTLALEFVDRSANKLVWNGTVNQKLDIQNKQKSLDRASQAVVKLLKQFPPKGSGSK